MADKALNKNNTAGASLRRRRQAEEPDVEAVELEEDDAPAGAITPKKDRATPSQRHDDEEDKKKGGNFITRTVRGLGEYFEGVRSELRKVAWPTREEARRLTIIVLVSLIVSSLVLGAISLIFTELFRVGLDSPLVLFLVMIVGVAAGLIYNRLHARRTTTY